MTKYKRFEKSNLDECTHLFIKVYSRGPWNDHWESFEQAREYLLEFINNPVFTGFVAYDDVKIIGVCLGHQRSWWGGKEYYVNEFFIDPEIQGKGIGTSFMEFIKKSLAEQGIKTLVLITGKGFPAEMFYKKNQFRESESIIFMVCNGLDGGKKD
jgi:aminoglycoside 6'-N-acetyltransferase I